MMLRISLLLVLLQCSGTHNLPEEFKPTATVEKYVAGAGGGAGVRFELTFDQAPDKIDFKQLIINGDSLETTIIKREPLVVEASRFYPDPEPQEGKPYELGQKPLYDTNQYRGMLILTLDGEQEQLIITEFRQKPAPLYE